MKLVKATPVGRKLRGSVQGPSGSGKTRTALRIASGIVQREGGRVVLIDAEEGRSRLEAHNHDFDIIELDVEDRTPEGMIKALRIAEQAGATVAILDGASEEWKAILKAKDAQGSKEKYTGWALLTPRHDGFFDAIRRSPIHVILTYRMRMAHEVVDGKVSKLGLSPIAREETEYEIDLAFEMDLQLRCRISKPPRGIFDIFEQYLTMKPGEELGHKISDALRGLPAIVPSTRSPTEALADAMAEYKAMYALIGAAHAREVLGKAPEATVEALTAATAALRRAHDEARQAQESNREEAPPDPGLDVPPTPPDPEAQPLYVVPTEQTAPAPAKRRGVTHAALAKLVASHRFTAPDFIEATERVLGRAFSLGDMNKMSDEQRALFAAELDRKSAEGAR